MPGDVYLTDKNSAGVPILRSSFTVAFSPLFVAMLILAEAAETATTVVALRHWQQKGNCVHMPTLSGTVDSPLLLCGVVIV